VQIHIIGAGSLGLLFGARLAKATAVTLVTRSGKQAETIGRERVTVTFLNGDKHSFAPSACSFDQLGPSAGSQPDWLFLMLKQKDIDEVFLKRLNSMVGEDTRVLCFQNGLGHTERLMDYVAHNCLWTAVTTEAARRNGLTEVTHTGKGLTLFGPAISGRQQGADQQAADELTALMAAAGFLFRYEGCMKAPVWEKVIINAVINPLTALLRIPNGQLCHGTEYLGLMNDLYLEATEVAAAEGVSLSPGLWEKIGEICRMTAANRSSMLQDVEAGRRTENEWISGTLVQIADKHHLNIPVTRTIFRLIRTMEPV